MKAAQSLITSALLPHLSRVILDLRKLVKAELVSGSVRFFECAYPCKDPECPAVSDVGHQHYELVMIPVEEPLDPRYATVCTRRVDGKEPTIEVLQAKIKSLHASNAADIARGYLVPLREV